MEDSEIVDLYWARKERAISESHIKYGRMLHSISFSLVPREGDADECLNDTYLAAWNSMPEQRPKYLGAYLSKIIRRLSVDRFRAAHAAKRNGIEVMIDELCECIPDSSDPLQELDNRELSDALNRFLRSLDGEKRYIFVRRYFYSDSLEDIALQLSVSTAKVKSILFRTRASLRSFLEKEDIPV